MNENNNKIKEMTYKIIAERQAELHVLANQGYIHPSLNNMVMVIANLVMGELYDRNLVKDPNDVMIDLIAKMKKVPGELKQFVKLAGPAVFNLKPDVLAMIPSDAFKD